MFIFDLFFLRRVTLYLWVEFYSIMASGSKRSCVLVSGTIASGATHPVRRLDGNMREGKWGVKLGLTHHSFQPQVPSLCEKTFNINHLFYLTFEFWATLAPLISELVRLCGPQ